VLPGHANGTEHPTAAGAAAPRIRVSLGTLHATVGTRAGVDARTAAAASSSD
jgi:hypothetical protein